MTSRESLKIAKSVLDDSLDPYTSLSLLKHKNASLGGLSYSTTIVPWTTLELASYSHFKAIADDELQFLLLRLVKGKDGINSKI